MLGVGELKIKCTILVLVWVLPIKAELERKTFIWDCEPKEQDSRRRFVKKDGKKPTGGCISTLAIHSQCSSRNPKCRELMPLPTPSRP